MLAYVILLIPCLLVMQIFLADTVADWLAANDGLAPSDHLDPAHHVTGRFAVA